MEFAVFDAVNAHAACGDDREAQRAIVDGDHLNAFLFSAVERGLGDGPVRRGRCHRFPM